MTTTEGSRGLGGLRRSAELQLVCVLLATTLAFSFGVEAGVAAVVGFVVLWPPQVPWVPLAALRVVATYVPFAILWVGFVIGYLRLAHACGWPVPPQDALERLAHEGLALPNVGVVLFGIVVIAPVLEEAVFRGYVFTALDRRLPRWMVHLLTAASFGAVHGLGYALPIGVLALYFGWLRARHGALLPSVLAHSLHNALVAAVTLLWPGSLELLYPR